MVEEVEDKADEECGEAVEEMMEGTGEGESQWSAPGENLLKKIVINIFTARQAGVVGSCLPDKVLAEPHLRMDVRDGNG